MLGVVGSGDLALKVGVDFLVLAVAEHRLIRARVRSEWARLQVKGLASVWAPACQDSSHVGNAGVGVVIIRGALVALPTFAAAQFKRFFDCGRAVRCLLPLGGRRFMHLFVLNAYQGADTDAEQLALNEQLFDAAWSGLGWLHGSSPVCLLATSTWSPPKFLPWQKGFRLGSGLILRLLGLWLLVCNLLPLVSGIGVLVVVTEGTLFLVALLPLLLFFPAGFSLTGTSLWPASWLPSWLRFKGFGRFMVSVFSLFMSRQDALQLGESLDASDVSRAWLVWSGAAETALVDAYQFSGGPIPTRGLVLRQG